MEYVFDTKNIIIEIMIGDEEALPPYLHTYNEHSS